MSSLLHTNSAVSRLATANAMVSYTQVYHADDNRSNASDSIGVVHIPGEGGLAVAAALAVLGPGKSLVPASDTSHISTCT